MPIIILNTDTDDTAAALVATIRHAVNGTKKYAAYIAARTEAGTPVTRDNVKDHALALAVLAYPNDKPVQKIDGKRTRFGNAVQAPGNGLRSALGTEDSEDTPTDWTKLVRRAVENAHSKGDIPNDVIVATVADALGLFVGGNAETGVVLLPAE